MVLIGLIINVVAGHDQRLFPGRHILHQTWQRTAVWDQRFADPWGFKSRRTQTSRATLIASWLQGLQGLRGLCHGLVLRATRVRFSQHIILNCMAMLVNSIHGAIHCNSQAIDFGLRNSTSPALKPKASALMPQVLCTLGPFFWSRALQPVCKWQIWMLGWSIGINLGKFHHDLRPHYDRTLGTMFFFF